MDLHPLLRLVAVPLLAISLAACPPPKDTDETGAPDPEVDADGDGWLEGEDCDDTSAAVHAGATEVCNGIDDDCDGTTDEEVLGTWYVDADGDGYGADASPVQACAQPAGTSVVGGDCDDGDARRTPRAEELCDGVDNDCDGQVDEEVTRVFCADEDGDAFGDPETAREACLPEGTETDNCEDCDDGDPTAWPGAPESCDGGDHDCDGLVLEDDAVDTLTWYRDYDADGYGNAAESTAACREPSGWVDNGDDCDDLDITSFPGNPETCDGADNDCDGTVDDGATDVRPWYPDRDGDTFGDPSSPTTSCTPPADHAADATDCNDGYADRYPGAPEWCDGVDHDCDGAVDEDDAVDVGTWYADADGDGYGNPAFDALGCDAPAGYVATATDCDDGDASARPGAPETCDDADDDCNGTVDDSAVDPTTWYPDADGDGWGDAATSAVACDAPAGWITRAGDCDDAAADAWPGATELCNGADDDCDGVVDDSVSFYTWYQDADGDGWGTSTTTRTDCASVSGFTLTGGDCDDASGAIHPAATETCDDVDEDCDGTVDEGLPTETRYADDDGDGFGDPATSVTDCDVPPAWVADARDCDDRASDVFPGAPEACDGLDHDCDGATLEDTSADASTWYADADGDGYGNAAFPDIACVVPAGYVAGATDCDDGDADTHPGASERCDDEDDDCDGSVDDSPVDPTTFYRDADADGYGSRASTTTACDLPTGYAAASTDCDDAVATTFPGAAELCNAVDDDCDGVADDSVSYYTWYRDADGDGYGVGTTTRSDCATVSGYSLSAGDCDDTTSAIRPGTAEVCDDVDQDCDGTVDEGLPTATRYQDADGDGYGDPAVAITDCAVPTDWVADARDCDDDAADVHPGATEWCDGVDHDCDGSVDEASSTDAMDWFLDDDEDGWGDATDSLHACDAPVGYVADETDCDDTDDAVNPGMAEACNGIDDDCSGALDDGGACPCDVYEYAGHAYQFCTTRLTWDDARTACRSDEHYYLVTVEDADEEDWLVTVQDTYPSAVWWIGYADQLAEGFWGWENLLSSSSYTGWCSSEPSGYHGWRCASTNEEDCAVMHFSSKACWNDTACGCSNDATYGGPYYVCEAYL